MSDQFEPEEEKEQQELGERSAKAAEVSSGGAVRQKSMQREILEWVVSIVVAVVLALTIREFIFTVVKVDGSSMEPTLQNEDRLIVWRLGYHPEAGDIIVLHQKEHLPYIKRIIATEGQEVNIDFKARKVYVDGKELDEPYIKAPTEMKGDIQFPVTVPPGAVFVLGDNRNNSRDSRFSSVGMVAREDILGKAVFRLWPFTAFGTLK